VAAERIDRAISVTELLPPLSSKVISMTGWWMCDILVRDRMKLESPSNVMRPSPTLKVIKS
jgi:hypothetical protein